VIEKKLSSLSKPQIALGVSSMKMSRVMTLLWALASAQLLLPQFSHAQEAVMDSAEIAQLRAKAESGDVEAQFQLGSRYHVGVGVLENAAEAVKWYRLAADRGNAPAQQALGHMYDVGAGVPENDIEAVKWFRLSAEQGYARAQSSLGSMYETGRGVRENDVEAVKWNRLAADQGDELGQVSLGFFYYSGEGVPTDYVQAYKWWNLAAAQGSSMAKGSKELLEQFMTREQIAEAQRLSSEWKPKTE
jgi:TPR repeat protein